MQQQQQPTPSLTQKLDEYKQMSWGILCLLLTPALFALVLLRRGFGIDAVAPKYFLFGGVALAAFHDLGGIVGHWHNPPFFSGSFTWAYCRFVLLPVAGWRIYEAYRTYRKRLPRHTYWLGEPYLALLGIPMRIAMFLDASLLFFAGWMLERFNVDVAFGAWLMWGSVGLIGFTVMSFQHDTRMTRDLMNAELYAGHVQDSVTRAPAPCGAVPDPVRTAAQVNDDEVLTTGNRR